MKRTMNLAMVSLMTIACGAEPQAEPEAVSVEINVNPTTLEEATASLKSIDKLMRARGAHDPTANEALEKLRPRLDELNHLIARVEARPGQFVSFYESEPGVIGVSESGPKGAEPVLRPGEMQEQPLVALYERLSGGVKAPQALVQAEARASMAGDHPAADLEPGQVSISDEIARKAGDGNVGKVTQALTEGDGQWFRDNGCFDQGDARVCFPNWGGDSWANYNTRTSFLTIAPYHAPSPISLSIKYNGSQRFVSAIFQGEWLNFQWFSGNEGCGFWACVPNLAIANHRYDIFNANGKAYHWSFAAKWNCFRTTCQTWPAQ